MKGPTLIVKCGECGKDVEISLKRFKAVESNHTWRCKPCMNKYLSKKSKEYRASLSKEDKERISTKGIATKKNNPNPISEERKAEISARRTAAQKRRWNNLSSEDRDKLLKPLLDGKKRYYSTMDEDKLKEFSEAIKEGKSKMMEAEKQSMLNNMSIGMKKWWSSVDDEFKNKQMEIVHNGYKAYWNKLNDEEKDNILNQMHDGWNKWYTNLSDDEINNRNNKLNSDLHNWWKRLDENDKFERFIILNNGKEEWFNNLSDKEKYDYYKPIIEKLRYSHEKWWNELPDVEKDAFNDNLVLQHKKWWDNLPDKEKQEFADKSSEWWNNLPSIERENIRNNQISYWNEMPVTSKEAFVRKVIIAASGKNKLQQLFEERFNAEFPLFNLISEYPTTNRGIMHSWDYAVFHNDELVCLIDIDGEYYHADICDYDGMHSHEEYDEKRGLSILNDVKCCIIYEKDFDKSFEYLRKILPLSYDDYVEQRLREYRSMPFPYPHYTDAELLRSYRDLCKLNCDDKYHTSLNLNTRVGDRLIFHFHQSLFEPLIEAWQNDNLLRDMIRNGYLTHNHINRNKILQSFNIYEPCKRTSFISAGKAKMIMNRYLSAYSEVFCPIHNLGIMLAWIAMNKRYITQCNDEILLNETNTMLTFLHDNGISYDVEIHGISDNHQCLFIETDDEIDEYLNNYNCKCFVFVSNNCDKYIDHISDVMKNKSYIGNDKFIIVIENGD